MPFGVKKRRNLNALFHVAGEMTPVEKMEKEVVAMYKHDKIHRALEALAPIKQLFGRRNVRSLLF